MYLISMNFIKTDSIKMERVKTSQNESYHFHSYKNKLLHLAANRTER